MLPAILALALAFAGLCAPVQAQDRPAAAVVSAQRAAAGSTDLLPFKVTERTLANGLRVIVVPTGFPNIVSLQIPVQTGSRNEVEPGKSGFAHFFEHMMFRGTRAFPPEKYGEVIAKAGARRNAYTSDDFTNYHVTFSKRDLEMILMLEADRFQHLEYSEEAFKTESRAVLGEYNKNSADPAAKLAEATRDAAFRQHTYKHTTMGFLRDIEDMPNQYAYSKVFFDRWYRPEKTTLIIAGDVSAGEVLPLVEKYWGKWKRGGYVAQIPVEPPAHGPVYAHVPWGTATLPLVRVSFHAPAFSATARDYAALSTLLALSFGPTSDLYKRLVETEQKLDQLGVFFPGRADPPLAGINARVKKAEDAVYVRDEILKTVARIRSEPLAMRHLADAKTSARYGLVRSLDNTEQIAATVAQYVRYHRAFATINDYFRLVDALTPADLLSAAQKYLTDENLVLTTLSNGAMPPGMTEIPRLATLQPTDAGAARVEVLVEKSVLPQLRFKLLFAVGSARDPKGKEGLAALTAAMVARAGSRELRIDEITRTLFPLAGTFTDQVDKEMTSFTGAIHRDNWAAFTDIALPMLLNPGFRDEDFRRLKDAQKNALAHDLKDRNEEEFAKERLQTNVYAGTPYGHPVLGTVKGIESITLDDVRDFWSRAYTLAALRVGIAGDAPDEMVATLRRKLGGLPAGPGFDPAGGVVGRTPEGIEVEIIEKETRAAAISLGLPIAVTRAHADFVALWVAKTWLGEHRDSSSRLYQRIRWLRGMNYGDYAYIEAFPRGMFQFFPDPNLGRRAQLFEIWIRPVAPENAHFALRIAVAELADLIERGLSQKEFEATRDYLAKNVFLMVATQNQQLGYALDARWYGIPEFTAMMQDALQKLTVGEVNAAIRKHLSARNLSVVIVTKNAADLKERIVGDAFSPIRYDAPKSDDLLADDERIGRLKLNVAAKAVTVTPAAAVFAE